MFPKILVGVLAFVGTFIIQWYGNFTGKLPAKGSYLGFAYDSILIFNTFVLKEKVTWVAFVGVFAIIIGSVLVIAHKEVFTFIKK